MNSEDKEDHRTWSWPDRINSTIAVVALLIALAPYLEHFVSYLERPGAAISSPVDGEHVANNTFGVTGTAANIPADDDLWLVIRSGIQGRWYPVKRLLVTDGRWAVRRGTICPQPGPHDIEVFLVPDNGGGQFFSYLGSTAQSEGQGIDSIPPAAVLKAVSSIIVPAHATPTCRQGRNT